MTSTVDDVRSDLVASLDAIHAAADAAGRDLFASESRRVEKLEAEIESLGVEEAKDLLRQHLERADAD